MGVMFTSQPLLRPVVFGYRFRGCWCCLLALARCNNWVIFPCPDRERQGKRYNRRAILRWRRRSLVYPTVERQSALSDRARKQLASAELNSA